MPTVGFYCLRHFSGEKLITFPPVFNFPGFAVSTAMKTPKWLLPKYMQVSF